MAVKLLQITHAPLGYEKDTFYQVLLMERHVQKKKKQTAITQIITIKIK